MKYVVILMCSGAKLPSTAADQTFMNLTDNSDLWYKFVLRKIHWVQVVELVLQFILSEGMPYP